MRKLDERNGIMDEIYDESEDKRDGNAILLFKNDQMLAEIQ